VRTKNEKVLLAILAAIVFVSGNVFSYRWLAQKQSSLQLAYAQLRADQAEAKIDLQESDLWAQRKAWVSDHEPPLGDEGDAKAQVLEYVLKGARDNKLEIMEQSLNDVQHGAGGTRVNVSVKPVQMADRPAKAGSVLCHFVFFVESGPRPEVDGLYAANCPLL